MKTGVLLVNLGSPDSPSESDVRSYLKQFLSDPYVIDIPSPARWFLLNAIILPKRPKVSAKAYKKIWTNDGSPLVFYTKELNRKVQSNLGGKFNVQYAMRYGKPKIEITLKKLLSEINQLYVIALYPQYSLAATETAYDIVRKTIKEFGFDGPIYYEKAFYDKEFYLSSFAKNIESLIKHDKFDYYLFSYHGLPERQIKKIHPDHCLLNDNCCDEISTSNLNCYKAQCYFTTKELIKRCNLEKTSYSTSFQSRLGRTPWITPYTDEKIKELAKKGVKSLCVISPSFVSDCLETLEEIQIRENESFIASGGKKLKLVPSLNSEIHWAENLSNHIKITCRESLGTSD